MNKQRNFITYSLSIVTVLLIILLSFHPASSSLDLDGLPKPQVHSLPPVLEKWQENLEPGDYFDEITPTPLGYLIFSIFPIQVYLDKPENLADASASTQRFQQWVAAVREGIEEWNNYLPLVEVEDSESADIVILRDYPPLEAIRDEETGRFRLPRARSAQTQYGFYAHLSSDYNSIISHRCTIYLSPSQTQEYTLATARHELGHALGIWGHSTSETDVMYFSQVRNPPVISRQDINTLKKIYQQPTRLGWSWEN